VHNSSNIPRVFFVYDARFTTHYSLMLALSAINAKVLGELADALLC